MCGSAGEQVIDALSICLDVSFEAVQARVHKLAAARAMPATWADRAQTLEVLEADFYGAFCRMCRAYGCRIHRGLKRLVSGEEQECPPHPLPVHGPVRDPTRRAGQVIWVPGEPPCTPSCFKHTHSPPAPAATAATAGRGRGGGGTRASSGMWDAGGGGAEAHASAITAEEAGQATEPGVLGASQAPNSAVAMPRSEGQGQLPQGDAAAPPQPGADGAQPSMPPDSVLSIEIVEVRSPEVIESGGDDEEVTSPSKPAPKGLGPGLPMRRPATEREASPTQLARDDEVLASVAAALAVSESAGASGAGAEAGAASGVVADGLAHARAAAVGPPLRRRASPPLASASTQGGAERGAAEPGPGGTEAMVLQESFEWSAWEETCLATGVDIFGWHPCKLATLIGSRTCLEVHDRLMHGPALPGAGDLEEDDARNKRRRRKGTFSGRKHSSVVQDRLKRSVAEAWPQYSPCGCVGPCKPLTCGCRGDANFCEKFCGCNPAQCGNRFAGCTCSTRIDGGKRCSTRQCPCMAAGRECDPDLCGVRDEFQCFTILDLLRVQSFLVAGFMI